MVKTVFHLYDKAQTKKALPGFEYMVEFWLPSVGVAPVFYCALCDCVVTDCSSCASALKHDISTLTGIEASPVPVYDLNEFLLDIIENDLDFGKLSGRITYHDPCHLKRGQNIHTEPRALLAMSAVRG